LCAKGFSASEWEEVDFKRSEIIEGHLKDDEIWVHGDLRGGLLGKELGCRRVKASIKARETVRTADGA